MSTLTIRQLDPTTHALLRRRAAEHQRSVEAEVRAILDETVGRPDTNLLVALRHVATEVGGVNLEPPDRLDAPRTITLS